ncbi:hypothetical protein [Acinetobacter baumannii]|uniref:hypothetical protein n=1 Tax=Acinetobacter baumannii TaxID=470 RepID=UPI0002CE9B7C|nr:hypothetical protein [Acinetobacter baumannii]ENW33183.1 hypothetical protein F922_03673 [Acinetobacter baumannii NIPH 201]HDX6153113.1 hypothetical protein [Acinetobacter baumannii]HEE5795894.1 hypothetical protein [Acinetobacter baumannii]
MDILLHLFKTLPFHMLGFLNLAIFFILSVFLYIYINLNLKGICKILVGDELWYKVPLSPLRFHILSALPIVFFREFLNIKKDVNFKKLYQKDFYFALNKYELKMLVERYPVFFYTQYILLISGLLFIIFLTIAYVL